MRGLCVERARGDGEPDFAKAEAAARESIRRDDRRAHGWAVLGQALCYQAVKKEHRKEDAKSMWRESKGALDQAVAIAPALVRAKGKQD